VHGTTNCDVWRRKYEISVLTWWVYVSGPSRKHLHRRCISSQWQCHTARLSDVCQHHNTLGLIYLGSQNHNNKTSKSMISLLYCELINTDVPAFSTPSLWVPCQCSISSDLKRSRSWPQNVRGPLSWKRLEIQPRLQQSTCRKWHMGYQMVTWLMTSRDP